MSHSKEKVKKLPISEFLHSLQLAPRLVVELVVLNPKHQVLLKKRKYEPYIGYWHIPGGFLLKNETIDKCIGRLLEEEIDNEGKIDSRDFVFVQLTEDPASDFRGHLLHYIVLYKGNTFVSNTENLRFFSECHTTQYPTMQR